MKTENFDDAIRRKVESVHHSFNEEDIDRVFKHVKANAIPVSFWKGFGMGSIISSSLLIIGGLLFWNVKQMQEQKVLISKIESLEKNAIQSKADQASIDKKEIAYLNSDVYEVDHPSNTTETNASNGISKKSIKKSGKTLITTSAEDQNLASEDGNEATGINTNKKAFSARSEKIKVKSKTFNPSGYVSQNAPASAYQEKEVVQTTSITSAASNDRKPNQRKVEKASISQEIAEFESSESIDNENIINKKITQNTSDITETKTQGESAVVIENSKNINQPTSTKEASGKKVMNAANSQKLKKREFIASNTAAKPAKVRKSKAKQNKRENAIAKDGETQTNVLFKSDKKEKNETGNVALVEAKPDSLTEKAEEPIEFKALESPDSLAAAAAQKNELPILKRTLNYQMGVGGEKTNSQTGIGIFSELVLNNRLGFSAGLKFLNINDERYNDPEDYRSKRNHLFNNLNPPNLPDSSISNIGIQTTILQLPLAISYYHPLKRNFSLLFSTGTDIDLFVTQNLKYDHTSDQQNESFKREDFEIKRTNFMFNNFVISAGIQKQWKHLVLQASPYISPQLRRVEYKKDNVYFGFRFRAYYRF